MSRKHKGVKDTSWLGPAPAKPTELAPISRAIRKFADDTRGNGGPDLLVPLTHDEFTYLCTLVASAKRQAEAAMQTAVRTKGREKALRIMAASVDMSMLEQLSDALMKVNINEGG